MKMKMKPHAKVKVKKSTIEKFKKKMKSKNKVAINKKKRVKADKPETVPTTIEELNELQTTGTTVYNSNLFRLQIESVLVHLTTKRQSSWRTEDAKIREQLELLLSSDCSLIGFEMPYEEAFAKFVHKAMPLLDMGLFGSSNILFKFERSSEMLFVNLENVPGCFSKHLVLLEMPTTLFREKDYLNQKYLYRKAFFLAVYYSKLAEWCAQSARQVEIGIEFHKNNPYLPFIRLRCGNVEFEIFAVLNAKQFPRSRLAPTASNIRTSHVLESSNKIYATPFYNSVLSHDLNKMSVWLRIREMLSRTPKNVINGFQLVLLWFKQHSLISGFGSFDHELLLLLLHRLLNSDNTINLSMNCDTIFRKVMNWFLECEQSSDATFSSVATGVNEQLILTVRQLASETISLIESGRADACFQIFVQKYDFYEYFDALLLLRLDNAAIVDLLTRNIAESSLVDYVRFVRPLFSQYLLDQLNFALSDRVQNIVPFDLRRNCLVFGIRLKDDVNVKASGSLTIGPEVKSNDPQSKLKCTQFRDFWGRLSEMRRFRDGRVHECVHWNASTMHQKRTVLIQIVDFLLGQKLQIDPAHYRLVANEIEYSASAGHRFIQDELSVRVVHSFDALCVILKSLKTALDITAIEMLSPVFSNTELFPESAFFQQSTLESSKIDSASDLFKHVPSYVGVVNSVLQFSRHSQWPDSYEAIEYMKLSLLDNIKELLRKEQNIESKRGKNFLDIYFHGYVFRFRVFQVKSLVALKKVEENEASQIELDLNIMANVRAALKGIQSRNSSFGPSTALIVRWFRSQLLDQELIRFEFLEILNAYLYLRNASTKKHLPQIAFLEFIKFYAKEFDWQKTPYFVDFNGAFSEKAEQVQQIETAFAENRNQFPAVFVCTPFETQLDNKLFASQLSPSPEILKWSKLIAKQSFQIIQNQIYDWNFQEAIRSIFTPNLVGYDLLLKIKKKFIAKKIKDDSEIKLDNDKKAHRLARSMPVVEYSPVERYLYELRRHYGEIALFFYDSYDGDTIGVLWKPTTKACTLLGSERCLWEGREPDGTKMKFNYDAFIYEFVQLSGALIETVNRQK